MWLASYVLYETNKITVAFIEIYYFESEEGSVLFFHPNYGEITANIVHLNSTVFAYSIAVVFNNDSYSSACAVLFVDRMRNLIATTKFINRYSKHNCV